MATLKDYERNYQLYTKLKVLDLSNLTQVYNNLLDRNCKKLQSKDSGLRAIVKYLAENDLNLSDVRSYIPKAAQVKLFDEIEDSEPQNENKQQPEGAFRFNSPKGSGEYMRQLMIGTAYPKQNVNGILDPDVIIEETKKKFPESKAQRSDVAFNKTYLRKLGYVVPVMRKKQK